MRGRFTVTRVNELHIAAGQTQQRNGDGYSGSARKRKSMKTICHHWLGILLPQIPKIHVFLYYSVMFCSIIMVKMVTKSSAAFIQVCFMGRRFYYLGQDASQLQIVVHAALNDT
ncbi:hypothetical protein E2C01_012795 [Portunus trituberculatus]|uniref:Uncharacterized protein n=1 Tax=Portunus trituberculatus TaxID=210409 RepID=A0A5B7DF14_PORTR|nr:hypothetical protein [Portunus trituberculatus]